MSDNKPTRATIMDLLYEKMKAIMERPPVVPPTENMSMVNDLDADSLEATQIIAETTKHFKVRLSREEIMSFRTIGDLVTAITSRLEISQP